MQPTLFSEADFEVGAGKKHWELLEVPTHLARYE